MATEGNDTLTGTAGDDTIEGLGGDDYLLGGFGDDVLEGNAGNDTLDGGDGDDTMKGGDGDDVYFVGNVVGEDKTIEESADGGIDTVFTQRDITLGANIENASWVAAGGGGLCRGNGLDNVLTGIVQEVLMDGEGGIDTVSYAGLSDSVTIDLAGGSVSREGFGTTDTLEEIENARGGTGDDSLIGDGIDNVLDGNDGVDTMAGGYGDDTYIVDDAADVVVETDNDVEAPAGLVLPGGGTGLAGVAGINDTVIAAVNYTLATLAFVENLSLSGTAATAGGNALANELSGNDLANTLSGAGGADTLSGGGGNDTLDGGTGNDSMNGGLGNDVYIVQAANDAVVDSGGTDTVRAAVTEVLASGIERLVLIGAGAINGTGNTLANTLTGNAGANRLAGGTGNDTLDGGSGNDTLDGGGNADVLKGGIGNDVLVWSAADTSVNGGAGNLDTLALGVGPLNLKTTANNKIVDIEQIDLRGDGNNTLALAATDVLALSSTTNTLRVLGDAGDRVTATGFTQVADLGAFNRYTSGAAILLVEADVTVVV